MANCLSMSVIVIVSIISVVAVLVRGSTMIMLNVMS